MKSKEELKQEAIRKGFTHASWVDLKQLRYDFSYRKFCEDNYCHSYGANYSCPPDCGSPEELKNKVDQFSEGLLLEWIWDLPDYKDTEAILEARSNQNLVALSLVKQLQAEGKKCLLMGASPCTLCKPCEKVNGNPCRFPERSFSCMSAYSFDVKELAEKNQMEYITPKGTIGFFCLICV